MQEPKRVWPGTLTAKRRHNKNTIAGAVKQIMGSNNGYDKRDGCTSDSLFKKFGVPRTPWARQIAVSVEEIRLHLPFNKFAETIALSYGINSSTSPSPIYAGAHHSSPGSVQSSAHSDVLTTYQTLGISNKNIVLQPKTVVEEHRQDRLAARNIAFVGGKFEFEKLMRVFFVLSNKQKIHLQEAIEILEWIESAEFSVLKSLFTLPLYTVAAAWEQLADISLVLRRPDAFSKLLQAGLAIRNGEWLKARASRVLGIAIWLGLRQWQRNLLENGLSPAGIVAESHWLTFSNDDTPFIFFDLTFPRTPLQVAVRRSDADTLMTLIRYGICPNKYDTRLMATVLFEQDPGSNPAEQIRCLELLLEAGSPVDFELKNSLQTQGETSIERLGWYPKGPNWFSDNLWYHAKRKRHLQQAFDLVSQHSKRDRDSLTVPGLHDAASRGCSELLRYLNSRANPSGTDRNVLLEIALSQAASRGELKPFEIFLQIGVDPNAREIYTETLRSSTKSRRYIYGLSDPTLEKPFWYFENKEYLAETYVPAYQASLKLHMILLKILFEAGADQNQANLVDALLSNGKADWSDLFASKYPDGLIHHGIVDDAQELAPKRVNEIYDFLLREGFDIQLHGSKAMVNAIMRWGERELKVACLQLDWLHSKGVGWDADFEGCNLIHLAVRQRCDLNFVRFLVARGVKVHSTPCHQNSTMLHDALYAVCSLDVIDFLLQNGCDVNDQSYGGRLILQPALFYDRRGGTAATCAATCKKLMEAGATIVPHCQAVPFHTKSPSRLLSELIELPDIGDDSIINMLELGTTIPVCYDLKYPMKEEDFFGPLETAIAAGRLNLAEELLCHGERVHDASLLISTVQRSITRLCIESPENHTAKDFMTRFITSGPDINSLGVKGLNSLHIAAQEGSLNIAAILLENGADPNTPIKRVEFCVYEPIIECVFRHHSKGEIDPDEGIAFDAQGRPKFPIYIHGPVREPRALDVAAFHGRLDMVQLLLNVGGISGQAEVTPYDGAIDSARHNKHNAIVCFLEKAAVHFLSTGELPSMSDNGQDHGLLNYDLQ
ncbi:hypothetical protein PFICI_09842 [Pestalotiopsis fici W106-1]|uniref:Uncharacterized protein n=1 Tax=Pestalotiopsis fici (strain W106-1 / CGMCC3.15140) TaxID=1229662 RepID=W3WVB0_PESFW|nr:uncharacterized protein PFICI_09842 [Pestalotiopsis fici W106-1]ETS77780.1 hypothetical protein PFICI_09842 [Pestalotiopsis fici W106-1]